MTNAAPMGLSPSFAAMHVLIPIQSVLLPTRIRPEPCDVGIIVLTAPIASAAGVILSRRGIILSLKGIVTDAPPKSGEVIAILISSPTVWVSKSSYLCGRARRLKELLWRIGDNDWEIGVPNK